MTLPGTEAHSDRYADLDRWNPDAVLDSLWEAQLAGVAAVRPALPAIAAAVSAAAARLGGAEGRLVYAGAGTSGRIAVQDGAELPPTFDWPEDRLVLLIAGGDAAFTRAVEGAEDRADLGRAAMAEHRIGPADVVIGVAASGGTPFTLACLAEARQRGALTIGIANSADTPVLTAAEHPICVASGAEAIAGSTRLKAGTAQKVVLNLFSTALMVRLRRVYRGRMVDMVARNEKLRQRALRMVSELAACDPASARLALDRAGGKVKLAVLIAGGVDTARAVSLLREHGGDLRRALESGPVAP